MAERPPSMRILIADGGAAFVEKARRRLEKAVKPSPQVDAAARGPAFLDKVFSHPYDLIFLDAALPESSPLDLLARLLQTSVPLPVVMLAAKDDARLAVEAMKRGVLDFLLKDDFLAMDLDALLGRLGEASRRQRESAELQQINQMKNDFLATISHELRTPLTSILGLSELLASGRLGPVEKKQSDSLGKILEQSHNLVRLINQLLDIRAFARGEKREDLETLSLSALARERAERLRPFFDRKGVALEVDVPAAPLEVAARRPDLEKVFDHVVSNALKFTPAKGRVSVHAAEEKGQAVVRVSDTGAGLPTEALRYVFQKFFHVDQTLTRPTGGMGLGLAFCKEAVEAMGGRIRVESKGEGRGTTVVFSVPRMAVPSGDGAGPKTVLWVDDNPSMLDLVEVGFSSVSRAVVLKTARGGLPALESLKESTPDLVVLDIMMADMDGLEVLSRLKTSPATAAVPVLIVSGYKEAAKTALQRGANDYCLKPFRVADVVKKIESLLFDRPSRP